MPAVLSWLFYDCVCIVMATVSGEFGMKGWGCQSGGPSMKDERVSSSEQINKQAENRQKKPQKEHTVKKV